MWKKYLRIVMSAVFVLAFSLVSADVKAAGIENSQVAVDSGNETSGKVGKYGMLPIYGRDVKDGTYFIEAESGSPVFQVAEAELTVEKGKMQAVFTLDGEKYQRLYMGTAKEAEAVDESAYISFSENADGKYTYKIPVEALDKELNCAAYHKDEKKWYDCVLLFDASTLPKDALIVELPDYDMIEEAMAAWENGGQQGAEGASSENSGVSETLEPVEPMSINMKDGEYAIEVDIEGGSGKASISSPTILKVRDGKAYAAITWSSSNYDYMIVGTEKYQNESEEGANSSFEIPIACMDEKMPVIADTTAMGTPHEVSYTLIFYADSIGSKSQMPQEAAKRVVVIAIFIIVGGGILNHFVNKKK